MYEVTTANPAIGSLNSIFAIKKTTVSATHDSSFWCEKPPIAPAIILSATKALNTMTRVGDNTTSRRSCRPYPVKQTSSATMATAPMFKRMRCFSFLATLK